MRSLPALRCTRWFCFWCAYGVGGTANQKIAWTKTRAKLQASEEIVRLASSGPWPHESRVRIPEAACGVRPDGQHRTYSCD